MRDGAPFIVRGNGLKRIERVIHNGENFHPEKHSPRYVKLRQFLPTNILAESLPRPGEINPVNGSLRMVRGGLNVDVSNYANLTVQLGAPLYRTLDMMVVAFTATGGKQNEVTWAVRELTDIYGLQDEDSVRKQTISHLDVLSAMRLSHSSDKKRVPSFSNVPVCSRYESRNGIIRFEFSSSFSAFLVRAPVMWCPERLWTLNAKYNPNSYYFLRKITAHKRMNAGKANENRFSVMTLCRASPVLPTYEDVTAGSGHIRKRIIAPFIRDMDAFSSVLSWKFICRDGRALHEEDLNHLSYYGFSKLLVDVNWVDYPSR